MTAVSKNICIDKLDHIVGESNNTHHKTIKLKLIHVKSGACTQYSVDFNVKKAEFKIGDHVRISNYKKIFPKGYTTNSSEDVFVISKVKSTMPWAFVISDYNGKEIAADKLNRVYSWKINQEVISDKLW